MCCRGGFIMSECVERGLPAWNEKDRLAALRDLEILDTDPDPAFDEIVQIASQLCDAPIAAVNFIDEQRQWFKAMTGFDGREMQLDLSICVHALPDTKLLVIPDATKDPRTAGNPLVTGEPGLRFYAGTLLTTVDGLPLGTLCVLDVLPRPDGISQAQADALQALARAVMRQLELKRVNRALADSQRRLRITADAMPQMVWAADPDGSNNYYNRRWYEFTGAPQGMADGDGWQDAVHPDDRESALSKWRLSLSLGTGYEAEYRLRHRTGEYRWILGCASPICNDKGALVRWVGTCTDIHEAKMTKVALAESEERYRALVEASTAMVWRAAPDGSILHGWGWENFCGQRSEDYQGSGWLNVIHPDDRPNTIRIWGELRAAGRAGTIEYRVRHRDGTYRWAHARAVPLMTGDGSVREWVGTITDIHERKQAEEDLWRTANHDALTGLPNRVLFQRRLDQALRAARQGDARVGLLLIDLDDFKDVNDTLGHDAGDALLKETAIRLTALVRDCDTVARFGGDEFAVLVVNPPKPGHIANLAEIMTKRLRQPFAYDGRLLVSRASIGVASFPEHDGAPAELMKDADIALYRAKAEGRSRVVVYSPDMKALAEQRLALGRDMRDAISRDQIIPVYQPKICLSTGRVVGLEALARWQQPGGDLLTPSVFGAAFDDPEIATAMGKRLIGKIASDMRRWLDAGLELGRVAVNLASAEFSQPEMADEVLRILELVKVPATHFEIEVTESVLLDGRSGAVAAALEKFRERGVQIALDDFGTGYASLTHLKQFPVNHIKIDRSFISDLEQDADDEAIVAAVIGLGRSLNLQVTAEGVETAGQERRLRSLGCHNVQGYLYARPMAASLVPGFLTGWPDRGS
jgi:diguanylate cyclase (GGDEF)-like protein/PAS domain S-box-containing protein